MSKVIELEASFVLPNGFDELLNIIEKENFKFDSDNTEEDTYYTDEEETFVKQRICLRTRKKNDSFLELTYKPKTDDKTEQYGKREVNINLNTKDYEDMGFILESLGYKRYIRFKKLRKTYTKNIDGTEYNVMLDEIEGVGKFVELEILANTKEEQEKSKSKLDEFVIKFGCDKYEKKKAPYRDIVKEFYTKQGK